MTTASSTPSRRRVSVPHRIVQVGAWAIECTGVGAREPSYPRVTRSVSTIRPRLRRSCPACHVRASDGGHRSTCAAHGWECTRLTGRSARSKLVAAYVIDDSIPDQWGFGVWVECLPALNDSKWIRRSGTSARGGTRTHTPLRATDFESVASAVPPLGPGPTVTGLTI